MENFKIFFYIFFFVHEHILTHNLNREYYHIEMDKNDISRIIEMAWEDRTPFDAIEKQFGLNEDALKKLMRKNMKSSSYRLWRKRVYGRKTKHLGKIDFLIGRHKSSDQNKL